ncbi:MAG: hypothetical protein AAGF95_31410 [Chloroflexota bacterium]
MSIIKQRRSPPLTQIDTPDEAQRSRPTQPVTVIHPIALLEEPYLGSVVRGLIYDQQQVSVQEIVNGFFYVRCDNGLEGYIPALVCEPHAIADDSIAASDTSIRLASVLLRAPSMQSQFSIDPDRWFLVPEERLIIIQKDRQRFLVQRADGQRGYIPSDICAPPVSYGRYLHTQIIKPMTLNRIHTGASQLLWLSNNESLAMLGADNGFALVQRDTGQCGYIPESARGVPIKEAILRVGPIDLGWIVIGGAWAIVNWIGLESMLFSMLRVDSTLMTYLGLAVLLGLTIALWFSSRRFVARSFAIGIVLYYIVFQLPWWNLFWF